MADVKISGLPASTTPLTGAEVLPLVQSGVTKKVAVSNLTGTTVSNAGEVGVGGNTEGVVAGVAVISKFCVKNEGSSPVAGFVHVNDTTAGSGSGTFACRSRGTLATPTVVQDNDSLWNMYIAGNDGTDLALAAQIAVEVDGTPGSNDMPGRIRFLTTPDGSQAPTEAMRITSAQNVTLATGNLVIGTSGKGIDFSATAGTGTSELFADYEEGTFTPTLVGTTTDPTVTYSLQRGLYTKVGRIVTVTVLVSWTAFSGGSGNVALGNLPFTVEGSVGAGSAGSVASFNGFTLSVGRTSVGVNAVSNTTYGLVRCFGSAVTSQSVPVGDVAASGQVIYQITYST
jgi:hypothetical protein